jgi:hypothetical protein
VIESTHHLDRYIARGRIGVKQFCEGKTSNLGSVAAWQHAWLISHTKQPLCEEIGLVRGSKNARRYECLWRRLALVVRRKRSHKAATKQAAKRAS